ncbi:hypothetical protein Hanom_Chr08g00697251 [Helianthus anomalus]
MAMGICRQGSLSGGELGREIPSAVRGTVQLPFSLCIISFKPYVTCHMTEGVFCNCSMVIRVSNVTI